MTPLPSKAGFIPSPVDLEARFDPRDTVVVSQTRGMSVRAGLPPTGAQTTPRPTELLLAALAGCVLANVAINAASHGISTAEISARLTNTDADDPPRVAGIQVVIEGLSRLTPDEVEVVLKAVRNQSRMYNTLSPSLPVLLLTEDN